MEWEGKPTICLDFDGVIHSYTTPWNGDQGFIPDPPIPGVKEAIEELRNRYRVVIYSVRGHYPEGFSAMEEWLEKYGIEVDDIAKAKPIAVAYLDDRGLKFNGDWKTAIEEIDAFETWMGFR